MISSKYKKLCIKAFRNDLTPEEKDLLNRWLALKPDHRRYYNTMDQTWSTSSLPKLHDIDVDQKWLDFESRYDLETSEEKKIIQKIQFNSPSFMKSAWAPTMGIAMAVGLVLIIALSQNWFSKAPIQKIMMTQNAQTNQITLDDGSIVYMNHATVIEYEQPFPDSLRLVKLKGEAYFDVKPGDIPFEVMTDEATIRVLGTRFNIWTRDTQTRVMVTDGHVKFANTTQPAQPVFLKRGEMSQLIATEAPVPARTFVEDSVQYTPGWLKGYLDFYRMPLSDIAGELERTYNTRIVISDSVLANLSVTATYHEESLENVLESLALTLHMRIDKNQDGIVLSMIENPGF